MKEIISLEEQFRHMMYQSEKKQAHLKLRII